MLSGCWSPKSSIADNGRVSYVLFEDFEGRDGLSLIRSDGSGLTKLAFDLPSPGFPDWIS